MKAFPTGWPVRSDRPLNEDKPLQAEMDLRDYFAAAAIDCFHTTMNINDDEEYLREIITKLAKLSYVYADAMIEARK